MTWIEYLVLFGSVMLSGLVYFSIKKVNKFYLKLALSFSGSFLFSICIIHLIPELYHNGDHSIGYFIMLGFFIQIVLEFFSEGIEHGHIHVHKHGHSAFPLSMMLSLSLHSFLEGMPLISRHAHHDHKDQLLTGIIMHHVPVAFALMSMLIDSGVGKRNATLLLTLFALMAPMGAAFSGLISENDIINISSYFEKIMAVVIGIFLHISTTILFESTEDHRFNLKKLFVIVAGAVAAMITF